MFQPTASCALLAARHAGPTTRVLCLHLHLCPVALPLVWRGAGLATTLCGIEAWKPLRGMQRQALFRSDTVLAISEHTARRFRQANPGLQECRVQVCHPAVLDGEAACAPHPDLLDPYPTALIVGRLVAAERYKGHDLLLDLWPRVLAQVPEARLAVVGDGDDKPRLEGRAAALRLTERVTFLGRVSDETLAGLYRDCTFFVMPSRNEGFGLVFLEAMRASKACIGGGGAAAEIIEDGVTGLVVEPCDREQVLGALLRLFREPATRERMGRAGTQRWAREFTEACFQRRFRALLGLQSETASCAE
jgi:phosphatidylinositol alpha-1,6-mannosyltransferase